MFVSLVGVDPGCPTKYCKLTGYAVVSSNVLGAEVNRYQPWEVMQYHVQTTNINFGLGATFANKMIELDLNVGVIGQEFTNINDAAFIKNYRGVELGFDFTYNLQGKVNSASERKKVENSDETSDNANAEESDVTPAP